MLDAQGESPAGPGNLNERGQAAARFKRRAATPNAVRDRNNNAKVDPVSETAETTVQTPGLSETCPVGVEKPAR